MPGWDDIFSKRGRVFIEPHPDMERLAKLFRENEVQKIFHSHLPSIKDFCLLINVLAVGDVTDKQSFHHAIYNTTIVVQS